MSDSLSVADASLLIYLTANMIWKGTENDTSIWDLATHIGDMDGVLGFWLWSGPIPDMAVIWRMMEELFLYISSFLSVIGNKEIFEK